MKRGAIALVVAAGLATPAAASADVFGGDTISGSPIPCPAQSDGVRVCHGADGGLGGTDLRLKTFDGSALEVYVILPPSSVPAPYPLVVQGHGWGSSAGGPTDTQFYGPTADSWAKRGYAVLQLTSRGFNDSCGSTQARAVGAAACVNGYIRLDDERYEARDVQYAVGLLVDAGLVNPQQIGVTGESYGGGLSLELATLKDRVMNVDGTLSPWTSPGGTPLHIAAAAPVIPWSDLAESLVPNGRTLDYRITGPTDDLSPIGVLKQSFVAGLFALGAASGYYSTTDSQANLPAWYAATNAGEPYDSNPQDTQIVDMIAHFHSPYYLLDGKYGTAKEAPAPLLIANGFTDDLFPVDEALRYYNLERSLYPGNPIALLDGDFGHMRAQNKPGDQALLLSRIQSFFDYYLRGSGGAPPLGVTATTETCPASAPSGGPFSAASWDALHPGEVSLSSGATQTITSAAGDPSIAKTVDPLAGGGACATAPAADQGSGVATYRLPSATGSGYTLLGAPTVIANVALTGQYGYIAERLWDVDPRAGTETLVARGVYRLDSNKPDGLQVFQLHPGSWHFAAGHVPKLELLGQDPPYLRPSNVPFSIDLSNVQVRLPVHEVPGAPGTPPEVHTPLPHVFGRPHGCVAYPVSRIFRRSLRMHASRHSLFVAGRAGERPCAHASRATRRRARVRHVYLIVYRIAGHGRCRFLTARGSLTRTRSCKRPVRIRTRGTRHWSIRLRLSIPPGRYVIRSEAVDGLGHRQRRLLGAVVHVNIR